MSAVEIAIGITKQDFMVADGLRTVERQRDLVAKGASQTMKSMHLKQADGFGHAVDLVPYDDGPRWEWALIYPVAEAMQIACGSLGIDVTWGAVWDRQLIALVDLKEAVAQYCLRHPGSDFLDGPHYQLRTT